MATNPNGSSLLDPGQIIKRVYTGEANDAIRVEGQFNEQAVGQDGQPAPADIKVSGGVDDNGDAQALHTDTDGDLQVDILSSALPTGAATEATLLALSGKSAAALVPSSHDYIVQTYITSGNGTGQLGTVTFKSGGAAGTTVALLTLTYDASDRLISVEKT